jgi:hypothetical protein
MCRDARIITLNWRDENYGPLHLAAGFRYQVEPPLSATGVLQVNRLFRRHHFGFNPHRMSWIAEGRQDAPENMIQELKAKGYQVVNNGCVPDGVQA